MHTCSKFDFLWILSRYDKFVMSDLWQNSCKPNGIISDHSLAKQVCSKTVAILSENACVTMVTSALALTCCKLVMNLQTCHAELAASLQTYNARFAASLLQVKIAIWDSIRKTKLPFFWKMEKIANEKFKLMRQSMEDISLFSMPVTCTNYNSLLSRKSRAF